MDIKTIKTASNNCYFLIIPFQLILLLILFFLGQDVYAQSQQGNGSKEVLDIISNFFSIIFTISGLIGISVCFYSIYSGNKREALFGFITALLSFSSIKLLKWMRVLIEFKIF